jgi:hypothetical protein
VRLPTGAIPYSLGEHIDLMLSIEVSSPNTPSIKMEILITTCRHSTSFFLSLTSSTCLLQVQRVIVAPDHTHTHSQYTPMDKWSTPSTYLYVTTHNIHRRQTSMSPEGFEPAIPASKRSQIHALDGADILVMQECNHRLTRTGRGINGVNWRGNFTCAGWTNSLVVCK